MTRLSRKKIVIIAGPKGAGKTVFAREFLPREAGCPDFINADMIAAGLSPFDPERGHHHLCEPPHASGDAPSNGSG